MQTNPWGFCVILQFHPAAAMFPQIWLPHTQNQTYRPGTYKNFSSTYSEKKHLQIFQCSYKEKHIKTLKSFETCNFVEGLHRNRHFRLYLYQKMLEGLDNTSKYTRLVSKVICCFDRKKMKTAITFYFMNYNGWTGFTATDYESELK